MPNDAEIRAARRHVRAVRSFYAHVTLYLFVNAVLFAVDAVTPAGWWFHWPAIIWGIGLLFHGGAVVADTLWSRPEDEEAAVRRYLARHHRESHG